jgi:hypothetical protein
MKKETQIVLAIAVILLVVIAIVAIFMLTGGGGEEQPPSPPAQPPSIAQPPTPPMPSGPTPPTTAMAPSQPSERKPMWRPRKDPFAWLPEEVEAMQADAFGQAPFVLVASPPPPPKVDLPEPYEPQPKRRVAGIILGQTISAILEQEGELPQIVYPGDRVGEFQVAAITPEGVVLRRSKGNPREVRVPYEPPGVSAAGGARGGGAGGAGGAPGAPGLPGIGAPSGGRGGGPRGGGAPGI